MATSTQAQRYELDAEFIGIPATALKVSRMALGTWAMGGWMWGGSDESQSIATISAALDQGINLIDAAPVYGFDVAEEIVGNALMGAAIGGLAGQDAGHRQHPVGSIPLISNA
jgi:diketogulonate reductase-like aldo/keto reductase